MLAGFLLCCGILAVYDSGAWKKIQTVQNLWKKSIESEILGGQKKEEAEETGEKNSDGDSEQQEAVDISQKNLIREILSRASKEFTAGYDLEESFFLWFLDQYGEAEVKALQEEVKKVQPNVDYWHSLTGKSLHVLWWEYCRDTGFSQEYKKVYEKECSDQTQVVLDFTGDINLAENWSSTNYLDQQPGGIRDCISPALMEEMQGTDILMINNEYTYSTRGEPLPGKSYTFRANPGRVNTVLEMGADIVSLANNHVYDYGEEALLDTIDTLEQAQIPYVGAGRNLEEAMKPVYFIVNGRKLAIVSATQIERSLNYTKEAGDTTAGVLKTLNPEKFESVIREARGQSDYVIVYVHWGTENTNHYGEDQVTLSQAFVKAGADVIIGGHTHCLQGFDFCEGVPVIYSLGNFWFNNKEVDTGISQVVIHTDTGEIDFRFLPCIQRNCVTFLVEDPGEKQRILDFMERISAPGIAVDEDGYVRGE